MLEQWIGSFLGIWPRYASGLGAVLGAPIAETEVRAHSGLFADAVTFWAISTFFHLVTRYIAWSHSAPGTLWFVAQFVTWAVSLVGVALAFTAAGRLAGGRAGTGQVLSATAYLWAAVIPVQAVLMLVGFGLMEVIDPRVYAMGVASATGCLQLADPWAAIDWLTESARTRPVAYVAGYGLLAVIFLAIAIIDLVYGIAYLRVLRRLQGLGRGRFAVMVAAGVVLSLLALSLAEFFGWVLWKAQAECGAVSGMPPR
ncbi:MAG: hypothetical protein KDA73_04290 [Rhodobacteraceae bacterium]|nr:hypothetical protein [Paracoccaceae bacterium]